MPALPTWFTVGGGVGEQGTRGADALSGSSLKLAGEFTSERQAMIPSSRRRDGNLVATRGLEDPQLAVCPLLKDPCRGIVRQLCSGWMPPRTACGSCGGDGHARFRSQVGDGLRPSMAPN